MKNLLALVALIGLCGQAFAQNYGSLPGGWNAPAVAVATCAVVTVPAMGTTPIDVSGNPSPPATPGAITKNFYTTVDVQDIDASSDTYCNYSSNVSSTTTQGIAGAGWMGFRICASAAAAATPPSCPTDHVFALLPFQQLFCIAGKALTVVVCKSR